MKIAVITGCCGFIGQHTTKLFLDEGYYVYGIDKLTYASNPESVESFKIKYGNKFTFKKADICELDRIPDCDVVVNIAAESHVTNSIASAQSFLDTNVLGTQRIIDILCNMIKYNESETYLLHYSTDEVYGDIVSGSFTENALLCPSNPYSASKAAADMLIISAARTHGLKYNIVRPTNNYGEFQNYEKLIPLSVRQLQRNKTIKLHDSGEPIRTWLHAQDTARATLRVHEAGKRNEIYNISSNFEQKNLITVKKIINSYFNGDYKKSYDSWEHCVDFSYKRPGQDIRYSVDDSKLRQLGWKNIKKFDEEIDFLVTHFKKNFIW